MEEAGDPDGPPAEENFEGWRVFLLNAPPGNGLRKYLRKMYPSMDACTATISTWKGLYRPSLSLRFTSREDWSKAAELELQVNGHKMIYKAVEESPDSGKASTDGKSRVIPRIIKTMVLSNVPFSLWENKEKIPDLLSKYATFTQNDMRVIRVDNCFVGKVAISVEKFNLVPNFQVEIPAFSSNGEKIPDLVDQIRVTCAGFDASTPKEARPQKSCRICKAKTHWANKCPRKSVFTCDLCGSNSAGCKKNDCKNASDVEKGIFYRPVAKPKVFGARKTAWGVSGHSRVHGESVSGLTIGGRKATPVASTEQPPEKQSMVANPSTFAPSSPNYTSEFPETVKDSGKASGSTAVAPDNSSSTTKLSNRFVALVDEAQRFSGTTLVSTLSNDSNVTFLTAGEGSSMSSVITRSQASAFDPEVSLSGKTHVQPNTIAAAIQDKLTAGLSGSK